MIYLTIPKIEAKKLDLEIIDFDLRTTIEDACEMLSIKAHEKGLEFICLIDSEVPSFVRGDPGRIKQIFTNLAGNSIKFTDTGEIVTHVSLADKSDDDYKIKIAVKDTGIGIPENKTDKLFKSFSQVDASTTRKFGGTGLGLSISKQLTELMNGKIGVESSEDNGSTFWFTIVLGKQSKSKKRDFAISEDIKDKRILIVDDNSTNRRVFKEYLKIFGCRFDEAVDGEDALEKLHHASDEGKPFSIAIIDKIMPGIDGDILGKKIKEDLRLKDTNLIMVTATGKRGDASRVHEIGFKAYLTKPVKLAQLYSCLTMVLGKPSEEKTIREEAPLITRHSLTETQKQNLRILIAEDNLVNQKLALKLLEKFGYNADVASNGAEAVEALKKNDYHLVFMDIQMPVMGGFEATQSIRNDKSDVINSKIPIIAMTAHAMTGDKEKCLEAGMNDYVSKPIKPDELHKAIKRQLNNPTLIKATTDSAGSTF